MWGVKGCGWCGVWGVWGVWGGRTQAEGLQLTVVFERAFRHEWFKLDPVFSHVTDNVPPQGTVAQQPVPQLVSEHPEEAVTALRRKGERRGGQEERPVMCWHLLVRSGLATCTLAAAQLTTRTQQPLRKGSSFVHGFLPLLHSPLPSTFPLPPDTSASLPPPPSP